MFYFFYSVVCLQALFIACFSKLAPEAELLISS